MSRSPVLLAGRSTAPGAVTSFGGDPGVTPNVPDPLPYRRRLAWVVVVDRSAHTAARR
ncbi:MAG: hypothetical protein ACRDYD_06270 [Acidimicrobiales bacterium]